MSKTMTKTTGIATLSLAMALSAFGPIAGAAEQAQEKTFVWYCESDEATAAQKKTVSAILNEGDLENYSCKDAFELLKEREGLELDHWGISDLAPLQGMTKLKSLVLTDNNLVNMDTMPDLKHLDRLDISGNSFKEFPKIKNPNTITKFSMGNTEVRDFTELQSLTNLQELDLSYSYISDLSILTKLKVTSLRLDMPHVPEVFATMPALPTLEKLYSDLGELEDLSFTANLPNVKLLSLSGNRIKSLAGIEKLSKLESLLIYQNEVEEIPPQLLPKTMKTLVVALNPIKSFDFLKDIETISLTLNLDSTEINDWGLMSHLVGGIMILSLYDTPIEKISIPEGETQTWAKMEDFDLGDTKISDLSFFKQVKAPELLDFVGPTMENKTEENCPTEDVPEAVAKFCAS